MAKLITLYQPGTHRLIPAKWGAESVLETLPLPSHVLAGLSELDSVTNERKIAENGGNSAIGPGELLLGVPEAQVVNGAFTHPGLTGARFHGTQRGAWYAGFEIDTSIAEVAFHKRRFLADSHIEGGHEFDYIDFLADFSGEFHTLEGPEHESCLQPNPVPQCYSASQALANKLLFEGSNGIVYPSVRRPSGTCIACFRPALVNNPRRGKKYRFKIDVGTDTVDSEVLPA